MKILFLVGQKGIDLPTEDLTPFSIVNTATVYNFFLRREIDRIPGLQTATYHFPAVRSEHEAVKVLESYDPPEADHVICLVQRGFSIAHPLVCDFFRRHVKGAVCAICDHDAVLGPEDYLFHVQMTRHRPPDRRSVHVSWAASPEFCYPDKVPGVLTMLVDHNNYSGADRADEVVEQIAEFHRKSFRQRGPFHGFDRMIVRQFKSRGVETLDLEKPQKFGKYDRKGVPYPDAAKEYRRADVFFVTKPESMGLSMIECAMSGALIVAPRGYANPYLLEPLNHVIWEETIDFERVLGSLDVGWTAKLASPFNWQNLSQQIVNTLRLH